MRIFRRRKGVGGTACLQKSKNGQPPMKVTARFSQRCCLFSRKIILHFVEKAPLSFLWRWPEIGHVLHFFEHFSLIVC